jgi:hypothetical protein
MKSASRGANRSSPAFWPVNTPRDDEETFSALPVAPSESERAASARADGSPLLVAASAEGAVSGAGPLQGATAPASASDAPPHFHRVRILPPAAAGVTSLSMPLDSADSPAATSPSADCAIVVTPAEHARPSAAADHAGATPTADLGVAASSCTPPAHASSSSGHLPRSADAPCASSSSLSPAARSVARWAPLPPHLRSSFSTQARADRNGSLVSETCLTSTRQGRSSSAWMMDSGGGGGGGDDDCNGVGGGDAPPSSYVSRLASGGCLSVLVGRPSIAAILENVAVEAALLQLPPRTSGSHQALADGTPALASSRVGVLACGTPSLVHAAQAESHRHNFHFHQETFFF